MAAKVPSTPVVLTLPAEIDITNHAAAAARLVEALAASRLVIVNMTGTTFCDCSGMRMLLATHDRADASGSSLRFVIQPGSAVARALGQLGMDNLLPVYASVEDAMPEAPARPADSACPVP